MPIYDYQCKQCDDQFELLVYKSTVPTCPKCGSESLQKLISLTAPQSKTRKFVAKARAQANKEGHFSNYSASERKGIG